jgi:hypothetical protein
MNRSSIAWKSEGTFNVSFKRNQTFFRRLPLVTKVGFMATAMQQTAIVAMDEPSFTSAKGSSTGQEQRWVYVGLFLFILKG